MYFSVFQGINIKGDPCVMLRLDCMVLICFTFILSVTTNLSQISTSTIWFFFSLTSFKYSTDRNMLLRLTSFWHDIYPRITSRAPIHKNHYFQPSVILPFRKIPFFSSHFLGFWLVAWLILRFVLFYFVLFCFVSVQEGAWSRSMNSNIRIPNYTTFPTVLSTSWKSTELVQCSMCYDKSFLNYTIRQCAKKDI